MNISAGRTCSSYDKQNWNFVPVLQSTLKYKSCRHLKIGFLRSTRKKNIFLTKNMHVLGHKYIYICDKYIFKTYLLHIYIYIYIFFTKFNICIFVTNIYIFVTNIF